MRSSRHDTPSPRSEHPASDQDQQRPRPGESVGAGDGDNEYRWRPGDPIARFEPRR